MAREALSNIGMVCADHSPKPNAELAKKPPEFFVGKYVKKAFKGINQLFDKETFEHMWVKVLEVKDGKLLGVLDSDPMLHMAIECGSPVTVELAEIEELA